MYAKTSNGQLVKFPYNLLDLKKDHPNTSFPSDPSDSDLEAFEVYKVAASPVPEFDSKTHTVIQSVEQKDGIWTQTWQVATLDQARASENVRAHRNRLLAECDWTQLADSPLDADGKAAWALYRETLRMIPQQAGFPWNVEWPPEPQ